ncbi:inositol monophosphatase [bacterium]|nr:inositol monophosphatase [bacterium]
MTESLGSEWEKDFDLAERAARAAGGLLREMMAGARVVLSEIGRDIKMQADRDAESLILKMLRAESPHPIISEETEQNETVDGLYWVVDPLDGTLNFSRQIPACCTSIGLMRGDEPILGVIYDFNRDEMFSGIVGRGAWLNGKPMKVSEIGERSKAIVATGMPIKRDHSPESLREYINLLISFKKTRMFGAAAIALAYVACGRVDAYCEEDFMLWDVAGGAAIIRAAGGWIDVKQGNAGPLSRIAHAAGRASLWA